MQIIVKKLYDKTSVLQVDSLMTVGELRQKIHGKSELQLLLFRRKRYEDSVTMEEIYELGHFTDKTITVSVTGFLRGGKNNIRHSPEYNAIRVGALAMTTQPSGDYRIGQEQLSSLVKDTELPLKSFGGVKGLSLLLKTNLDNGINGDDADLLIRRNTFGSNAYPRKKRRSFWMFLWEAWNDLTLITLMVAAILSLALGMMTKGVKEGWYDGGSIAFSVIILIVVTAINDYRQYLQFQNLNDEKRKIYLEVIRGGKRVDVSIFDLVVGDVVPLKIGDQVPADGILIVGHSLAIDESSMTGESEIVHKGSVNPFLMSGCKVADGNGTMLVIGVGINTEWGLLMASISEDTCEETPLQIHLNGVATIIGIVGLLVAIGVLVVLLVRFFSGNTRNMDGTVQFVRGKTNITHAVDGAIKIITLAVAIVVCAVPEGLPLAVRMTLAYSMRKMMSDQALVRRLAACETMGLVTTICSEKRGALTLNQMIVTESYIGGQKVDTLDYGSMGFPIVPSLLIESIEQNTTGSVFISEGGEIEVSGSPIEKALLSWLVKLGVESEARPECSLLQVFPFSSEIKRSGVAVKLSNSKVHVHWKGAAEIVLASCTSYLDTDGSTKAMDDDRNSYFKQAIEDMAAGSLCCVAFAYRLYDEEQLVKRELPENDLVLLAVVGLKDPCRPGVKDSVWLCENAGIKVRMVTGDNLRTAKAVALECGILRSDADATEPILIEGKVFRAMSDIDREEIAEKILVMGRSSPYDKLLLIQALRRRGHVVAATGNRTNDAPSLHEADIGLSMGIHGMEVAKESSDIIILDDSFASVVKVVRWGRSLYVNMQKFIQFQITVIAVALIVNIVSAVFSGNVPLNAVQLLWVNLIMDPLGVLALATEQPSDNLMHRRPVGRRESLITNIMWRNLLVQALYQVTALLVLHFDGRSILHLKHDSSDYANKMKNTLIFNIFVLCQIFNKFNARKPDEMNVFRGITRNSLFMAVVAIALVFQVIIIEFLGKFTTTVKLDLTQWLVCIVISSISWPLAMVGKLLPVPEIPLTEFFKKQFQRSPTSQIDIP